jgi:adenine-specific DNA glycosylase
MNVAWEREISPLNLLQERFREEPWKMVVLCIMLNQTHYKQVDRVRDNFFKEWPSPEDAAYADKDKMREILRPLGFYNRRTKSIMQFSKEYFTGGWTDIGELYGVGKYARDSWLIFQEGIIPTDVTDKKLIKYVDWINEN